MSVTLDSDPSESVAYSSRTANISANVVILDGIVISCHQNAVTYQISALSKSVNNQSLNGTSTGIFCATIKAFT